MMQDDVQVDLQDDLLLSVRGAGKQFMQGSRMRWACRDVSFDLFPGEVLAVVGESGSGKSTLLRLLAARLACDEGSVHYDVRSEAGSAVESATGGLMDLAQLSQARLRWLARTDWGFVEQHARDGLRMNVSGGANIGERMMALGARHYGKLRSQALDWMERVELDVERIDDLPGSYSGGMQQRLQIARNLVTHPRLVFMDEPTTGLDVSVQARLLDLLRELVDELNLAAVIVTHDLAVARLLAHRMLVMKDGCVVEQGLTDRVLDDPQHPYTQLLVSSVLTP
ncbi:phosphonate C-P lyase system protein PhnK [Polaromonas sp. YR568]|uniref:phosphonate C-P lyase system protein PhnK n=1 Tax=Polaromonas sp. YR568 TaxID=1855301 RepID=UPI0031383460